jgi:anti-sigma factor RsiW
MHARSCVITRPPTIWADSGMGYSLVGQSPMEALRPIANEVRRQARTI